MTIPKHYFQDRLLLFVFSLNLLLTFLLFILTIFRIDTAHSSYIVQYRSNATINAFQSGSSAELVSFVVFGFLVLILHTILSLKVYLIHRQLAVVVLGLGTLLLILALIVSNALLVLR